VVQRVKADDAIDRSVAELDAMAVERQKHR
jgi:hypothetical protein